MLNGLDLFSGIGGLTIALADWVKPVAYCESDRYAQSVLLSRMSDGTLPVAPIWDDVRTLRAGSFRLCKPIDIIYGGFPCQDISIAGRRAGLGGERSRLFFEIIRLARELRPSFIFLENVAGVVPWIGAVTGELAALRYDCRWGMLRAWDVGALHVRERWFCLANSNGSEWRGYIRTNNNPIGLRRQTKQSKRPCCENRAGLRDEFERLVSGELQLSLPTGKMRRMADGIQFRTYRLAGLGNAVVPAQAREAFSRLIGMRS